jgi:hypothetical protein
LGNGQAVVEGSGSVGGASLAAAGTSAGIPAGTWAAIAVGAMAALIGWDSGADAPDPGQACSPRASPDHHVATVDARRTAGNNRIAKPCV